MTTKDAPPGWQIVENVVAAVERILGKTSGWRVTQNVMVQQRGSDRRRQVDVFAEWPEETRAFRIGIDVKAESAPLDIESMEQLCAKARKLDIDRYVVISTSGFTAAALEEAEREGVSAVRIEELQSSSFFSLEAITVPYADIHYVEVCYEAGRKQPPLELLPTAWIEDAEKATHLQHLASHYVAEFLTANRDVPAEEKRVLQVDDDPRQWLRLHSGGSVWDPPSSILVLWSARYERVQGRRFRTHDGHVLFTAIVPHDGQQRQFTMMTIPNSEGGYHLAISLGDTRPPRRNV